MNIDVCVCVYCVHVAVSPFVLLSLTRQKLRKDYEEKRVMREGRNSLITYPNASSFSVFSHIRHFVLQTQLCETYNSRLGGDAEGESEEEGEEEGGKKETAKMPVVRRYVGVCPCGPWRGGYEENVCRPDNLVL